MANTTNLDLVKPLGTDHALISVINSNMDKIDNFAGNVEDSFDATQDGIAIVSVGDTHAAITSGQFVYVRNHNTLSEGLYVATANIAANGALSASNLTADSSGGLNSVYSALNSKIDNTCYADRASKTSYTIPLTGFLSGNYWVALMYIQTGAYSFGLYLIFLNTTDAVFINPLVSEGGRTFTGVRSGNNIVLTANDTVWGGIRVLMMN